MHSGLPRPLLLVSWIVMGIMSGPAMSQEKIQLTIDPAAKRQSLEGFGASGAWWPHWVGDYPKAQQDQILDLLFTERGIALSIYRYNIPAGGGAEIQVPERITPQVEISPGKYDLAGDQKSLDILRGVRQRGVQRFVLFANSPPGRLTRNGKTSGGDDGESNLKPGQEAAFANYLVDIAALVRRQYDLPHVSLSPVNEPQWKWGDKWRGQEGCHYTPAEAAAVIRKVIDVIDERHLDIAVEAPESGAWQGTMDYADAMFADPVIDRRIGQVALHSYWSDHTAREHVANAFRQKYPKKQLLVSEYCHMEHGHDLGIDSALAMAEVIHDDLTTGGVVSWQWWLCVGPGGYQDALIYADPKTRKIEPTKRLWVLGQYSRFVRPGFTRVGAEIKGESLKTTAYLSPDQKQVVCVVINSGKAPAKVATSVRGFDARRTTLYVTDDAHDLAVVDTFGGIMLPPRSVSSIVFER